VAVLEDSDEQLMDSLNSTASPEVFFLNNEGIVVAETQLETEMESWDLVNKISVQKIPE